MEPLLLGIDIGTSACKAALFTPDGVVVAQEAAGYDVLYPHPGWAEQNPDDWWAAVCAAVRALLEKHHIDAKRIAAVAVDGQSWSAVAVDSAQNALANTPIWMDTRAAGICARLARGLGEQRIFEVCGNPLAPSYTLPKILWYKENFPELCKKTDKILQSNSFIAMKLTGEISQDISQCYGLQCFDMRKGVWDDALCADMGVRRALLPDIAPCHQIIGRVTKQAAAACGLAAGTPVAAGGLDAACGTLGAGVLRPGETQEQGGQAGGMSICMEGYAADPRLILSFHVVPGRYLLQGGTVGGGGVMRWLAADVFKGPDFAALGEEAAHIPAGAEGLVFLPYMAGERSPLWDEQAKGVFYGLDYAKTRGHMVRAALEGVAFSLRHNLEIAQEAGASVTALRAVGGAANSLVWTQIKADVAGLLIEVPSSDTATTLGAAMLAGVAAGVYTGFDDAVAKTVRTTRRHAPDATQKPAYDTAYHTYRRLYEDLAPLMHGAARTKAPQPQYE